MPAGSKGKGKPRRKPRGDGLGQVQLTPEQAAAVMSQLLGRRIGLLDEGMEDGPTAQAHGLAWDAAETDDDAKAVRLAKRALRLDPACVDAYGVLATRAKSHAEAESLLRQGIAAWERANPERQDWVGHYWGLLETRPYMRAKEALASVLLEEGKGEAAASVWTEMLKLNPNDNQGVRSLLLVHCLETGALEEASRLVKAYPEDAGADFVWSRILLEYLTKGPAVAEMTLRRLGRWNTHVRPMLLGKRKAVPIGEYVQVGGPDEASAAVELCGPAWMAHPEAVRWLAGLKA